MVFRSSGKSVTIRSQGEIISIKLTRVVSIYLPEQNRLVSFEGYKFWLMEPKPRGLCHTTKHLPNALFPCSQSICAVMVYQYSPHP